MAWETFQRRMGPRSKQPMVTFSKSGSIGLNAAVVRNLLGNSRYALLLFDRDRALVGIKLLKTNEPNAYPVSHTKSKSHAALSGLSFMKTYGVIPPQTRSFPATFDAENRTLIIDVSDVLATAKKTRKQGNDIV